MRLDQDMPYQEIALKLGISEKNVKARIHRARVALRGYLENGKFMTNKERVENSI